MRALKTATVVMGVLILAGTAVLIATIIKRQTAPAPAAGFVPSAASIALTLHEPAGSQITGLAASGDALAVSIHGGGPDRIVLIDPRTGEARGRITLAP
ncbi:MAG TPA: hypothetical protein VJ779_22210 [Acetobacteraceae bacterium]|jgi:hypothetical protein|nr:hypothetical protein [Acetobacteraceae bacterium]